MLDVGSTAPKMALEDTAGRPVHLTDYQGKANILIFFMRSATCPVCNRHVKDLAGRKAELTARNVEVLIAVPEGRAEAAAWQTKRDVPFVVVTGQQGTPHEAVGLTAKVFGSLQQSGSVLIDSAGIVRHAHGATMPVSSYDKKGIDEALRDLPVRPAA